MRRVLGLTAGVLSFAYLILVLNPIQMLSMLLYPFSRRAFREVNRWCARSIWGLWVIMAEVQNGIEIVITGDPIKPRENMLVLPNHQSMADVMVLLCFAWRCGRLGDLKWFVKDVVKYFPGFGWGMSFLDCLFVKRDWAQDRANIHRLFDRYKAHRIPVCVVSFLEGTRITPAKLAAAREYAKERGLYLPSHTLVPRTKGFVATIAGLRDHLDAVYDLTIRYGDAGDDRVPSLVNCFEAKVRRVHLHVKRYPIDALPADPALHDWVMARFREKDDLLADLQRDGRFPGPERNTRVRVMDWFRPEARRIGSEDS